MAEQSSEKVAQAKIIQAVRQLIEREAEIRQECGVGDNLRVVRNKLNTLLRDLEANVNLSLADDDAETALETTVGAQDKVDGALADDTHAIVYLHLFNVGGGTISNWSTMLSQKSLYEYSVNRPIYASLKQANLFAENKPPEERHAFLSFRIEKTAIEGGLDAAGGNVDAIGQPLLKLKEGVFTFENLIEMWHKGQSYRYDGRRFVLN